MLMHAQNIVRMIKHTIIINESHGKEVMIIKYITTHEINSLVRGNHQNNAYSQFDVLFQFTKYSVQ